MSHRWLSVLAVITLSLASVANARAQTRPIELSVDASEAPRRLLHATMKIPVKAGPLTLYYPKWIQGEHSPSGPISDLSGLKLSAGGKSIAWKRDDLDLYAFHCTIPDGVDTLDVASIISGRPSDPALSAFPRRA